MSRPFVEVVCPRCTGSGLVPRFYHNDQGRCFRCGGGGKIKMRAAPDGTADHDHRLAGTYWAPDKACIHCGLPAEQWPPIIPARWYEGQGWYIYWPVVEGTRVEHTIITGETRRKAQAEARRAIVSRIPNARIKWLAA